jgi:hypothetical protein
MKSTHIGDRWIERQLIDDAFDAYLQWRDESARVWHSYRQWVGAPAREARASFWAYRAALDREEHAACVYGRILSRLEAGASRPARDEKQRRSQVRPLLS